MLAYRFKSCRSGQEAEHQANLFQSRRDQEVRVSAVALAAQEKIPRFRGYECLHVEAVGARQSADACPSKLAANFMGPSVA